MIKETLKNAIRSLSSKHKISEKELRIKISKPNDNVAQNKIAEVKQILDDLNKAKTENNNAKKKAETEMKIFYKSQYNIYQ